MWCNEHDVPTLQVDETPSLGDNGTTGGFSSSNNVHYAPSYHETTTAEITARPAVKRRQVSEVGDDLNRNWVIVEPGQEAQGRTRLSAASGHAKTSSQANTRAQQRPGAPNRRMHPGVTSKRNTEPQPARLGEDIPRRQSQSHSPCAGELCTTAIPDILPHRGHHSAHPVGFQFLPRALTLLFARPPHDLAAAKVPVRCLLPSVRLPPAQRAIEGTSATPRLRRPRAAERALTPVILRQAPGWMRRPSIWQHGSWL